MGDQNKNVPRLRFPGYTDAWVKCELGKKVNIVMGQSPDSNNYIERPIQNSKILVQGNADLKNGWVYPRIWTTQVTKEAEPNDLILSVRAPVGDIGKTQYSIVLGRGVAGIKGNEFLFQYLTKLHLSGYWSTVSSGSTFESINSNDISSVEIYFPLVEEQTKIGEFFKHLDNLITVNERELNKLKDLKKSYLEKMFPKNGSDIPELRFPGYADAWVKCELGKVVTFVNGRAYKQEEMLDSGKYKILRVGNFYTNDSWYYSDLELPDNKYIDNGDLIYTWSATFGPHIWSGEKVIYHYHIWKVVLSEEIDKKFVLQILDADRAKIIANSNGSTMIHITKTDMESKQIVIPNIDEQRKIGEFFKQLDNLITVNERELNKLKELKKSYLKDMFV
ncbi:restriction endonuclease subunit S [Pseudolactococcus yaeyamensis]